MNSKETKSPNSSIADDDAPRMLPGAATLVVRHRAPPRLVRVVRAEFVSATRRVALV
jgi:hypothetical protein